MAGAAAPQTWHPVTPQIDDPDLAPPPAATPAGAEPHYAGVAPPPAEQGSWFSEHKVTIIISVVILIILIVVIYVYLTRRGGRSKKKNANDGEAADEPAGGGGGPPEAAGVPNNVDLDELQRLRMSRQLARQGAAAGQGPLQPQPVAQGSAMPQQGSATPQQGGAMPQQGGAMPPRGPPSSMQPPSMPPSAQKAPQNGGGFMPPPVAFGFPGGSPAFRGQASPEAVQAHAPPVTNDVNTTVTGGGDDVNNDVNNDVNTTTDEGGMPDDLGDLIESLTDEIEAGDDNE